VRTGPAGGRSACFWPAGTPYGRPWPFRHRAVKREGDGHPAGRFGLVRLWWRSDRFRGPRPCCRRGTSDAAIAWCEERQIGVTTGRSARSANEPGTGSGERPSLRLDHRDPINNRRPRIAGRGSAVFLHVARPDRSPTAVASLSTPRRCAGCWHGWGQGPKFKFSTDGPMCHAMTCQ